MFFRKRPSRQQNVSLDEIREAMREPEGFQEPLQRQPSLPVPSNQLPYPLPRERETAPLFVKLEKYRHITATVQDMKSFVSVVKQLFGVMHEIDTIRSEALTVMKATVQRLEKNLVDLENELLMPKGIEMERDYEEAELSQIESSLLDLQKQLSSLKKELQEFQ